MTLDNRVSNSRPVRVVKDTALPIAFLQGDIRKLTRKNADFRREIATTTHAQVTLMCLDEGDDIGEEIHEVDQLLVLVRGHGELWLEGKASEVPKGSLIVIAAGTRHNLVNTGCKTLQLYSIYAPPHHPRGTVHRTRADAIAAEARVAQTNDTARSRRPGAKILRGANARARSRKTS